MMELARRVGISVPDTALVPINEISGLPSGIDVVGSYAYAIKRFDRAPNNTRIHIEDFAQVFGVYPERKYDRASYRNIAEVIWTEMGEAGIVEFLRRLVFNVLIGNADMHLKNWSLIYSDRRNTALAPAYALAVGTAFPVGGSADVQMFSTSMSITRCTTCWIISLKRSVSEPFSRGSDNAMLGLAILGLRLKFSVVTKP